MLLATILPVIVGIAGAVGLIIIFSMMSISANEKEWFHFAPIQCTIYPWEVGADKPYFKMTFEEQAEMIKNYYEKQVIPIFEFRYPDDYYGTCEACFCGRGYFMNMLVYKSDISKIEENLANEARGI